MQVQRLEQPFAPPEAAGIEWTHWAPCPSNGQPLLFVIYERAESADEVPSGYGQFEAAVEWCYWHFDALRKGDNAERKAAGLGPQEERDAFKNVMRMFYGKWGPGSRP